MPETHERLDLPAALDLPLGIAQRPRHAQPPGVLDAARRRPLLALLPLLATLALALAGGLARTPVYTATAQLRVAGFDVTVPGALTGYATTAVALAATYSWSIDDPALVAAVAHRTHTSEQRVIDALSASALPESPVFRVRARTARPARAILLANAAASQLTHLRLGMASAAQRASRLRAFARAAGALAAARATLHQRQADQRTAGTPASAAALTRAEAAVATAQVTFAARRVAYLSGARSVTSTPSVSVIAPARSAGSDRRTTLELLLVIALAAGLSVGLALAVLAERRAAARRPALP